MSAIVETRQGRIEGVREGELVVFRGIPFAAPPTGPLRWLAPAPPKAWSGVRQATRFGPASPQNPIPLDILPAFDVGDDKNEDCLYLNVWSPGLDDGQRPVLVWIHGGAFVLGSGSQTLYDGRVLAERGDCVVVTINYRLGPFGFLNLNEVTGGRIPATGNEGLLDQIAALEWVRDNIASFGGDPECVTIFGESAGGMSVGNLLGIPRARGLFHRAIPQSGASSTANDPERAERVARRVLGVLGVRGADVDALRGASAQKLLEVQAHLADPANSDPELGGMPFQPCIDSDVLPRFAIDAVRSGNAAGVPILTGSTLEEWKLFAPGDPSLSSLTEDVLVDRVAQNVDRASAPALVEAYRKAREARGEPATASELFLAIETDRIFRIPALELIEAQEQQGTPSFSYLFTWPSPAMGGLLGACHALELGFVFGTIDSSDSRDFSGSGPAADALERGIQDSWLAFARTGDPSSSSLGAWPAYGDARNTMILGDPSRLQARPREEERRAWTSVQGAGRL